jgi:cell division protein FtsW (lipid II flippase)
MRKWYEENIHLGIMIVTLLLVIVGLISIYSATYDAGSSDYFYRQIAWVVIGFILMFAIMLIPFRTLQLISYPVYIISILLLIGVLILGKTVAGSTSWFVVGKMGLQPSEIVKTTSILALAAYLSDKRLNLNRLLTVFKASGFVFVTTARYGNSNYLYRLVVAGDVLGGNLRSSYDNRDCSLDCCCRGAVWNYIIPYCDIYFVDNSLFDEGK